MLQHLQIENNVFEIKIDFDSLEINNTNIAEEIGYELNNIPSHFSEIIDEVLTEARTKSIIKAGYVIAPFKYYNNFKDEIIIGGQKIITDKIVSSQLKKSDQAIIFLCSIGNEMENWSKNLFSEGDSVMGYLVDVTASTIVETVADNLHNQIELVSKKNNLSITNRYSPGYCNWSVAEQSKLFTFFPKDFCGVTLSDSNLMGPIKSISGIIGIGEKVKYKEYICDRCGIKDCTQRIYLQRKKKSNN